MGKDYWQYIWSHIFNDGYIEGVELISIMGESMKAVKLTESVSKSQQLVVTLQLDETGGYPQYYIQKWKLCSSDDWQADDSLDVYQSGE